MDCRLLLRGFGFGVLAAESLHSSGRVHQLLLAGKERMATRTDFYVDVAPMRRSSGKAVAACAHDAHFVVSGMDGCFHGSPILLSFRF